MVAASPPKGVYASVTASKTDVPKVNKAKYAILHGLVTSEIQMFARWGKTEPNIALPLPYYREPFGQPAFTSEGSVPPHAFSPVRA
ncbi:MAG: hypothetical protein QW429_06575 [Thermoprotei archaeon]